MATSLTQRVAELEALLTQREAESQLLSEANESAWAARAQALREGEEEKEGLRGRVEELEGQVGAGEEQANQTEALTAALQVSTPPPPPHPPPSLFRVPVPK